MKQCRQMNGSLWSRVCVCVCIEDIVLNCPCNSFICLVFIAELISCRYSCRAVATGCFDHFSFFWWGSERENCRIYDLICGCRFHWNLCKWSKCAYTCTHTQTLVCLWSVFINILLSFRAKWSFCKRGQQRRRRTK